MEFTPLAESLPKVEGSTEVRPQPTLVSKPITSISRPKQGTEIMGSLDCDHGTVESSGVRKTLVLVSHAHAPPLSPAPRLKFDLRWVTNPPKHIRSAYDGRSKRLRDHLLHEDAFVNILDTAEAKIKEEMLRLTEKGSGMFHVMLHPILYLAMSSFGYSVEEADHRDTANAPGTEGSIGENDKDDEVAEVSLIVSCFCERGKHRSVAFVEEIARKLRSSVWDVELFHRDVEAKREQGRKKRHKDSRSRNGAAFVEQLSD